MPLDAPGSLDADFPASGILPGIKIRKPGGGQIEAAAAWSRRTTGLPQSRTAPGDRP